MNAKGLLICCRPIKPPSYTPTQSYGLHGRMYHEQRFLRTTYYFFERRSTTATTDRSPRATHQAGQRHTRYAGSRRLKLQPPFFNLRAKEKPARKEWTPAVCGGLRVKEGARTWVLVVVGWC
jgi:hypothetical protein